MTTNQTSKVSVELDALIDVIKQMKEVLAELPEHHQATLQSAIWKLEDQLPF